MIMGHIGFGTMFSKIIHSFHMPLFFFISGIFFTKPKSFDLFVMKKSKSLLIPYLFFGIINYLVFVIVSLIEKKMVDITPLQHLFSYNTYGLAIGGALWFLFALLSRFYFFHLSI